MVPSGLKRGRKPKLHQFINGVEAKWCGGCKSWLMLDVFRPHPTRWDGLHSRCATCVAQASRVWRQGRAASPPVAPLDTLKTCSRCFVAKQIVEFRKQATGAYGRQSACRECSDVYNNGWRERRRPERLAYNREYYRSERGRQSIRAWHDRNPGKYAAQKAVTTALALGLLVKPTACETCGESKRLDGHHPDYAKPLEVMWLCRGCHKAWHKKHGEGLNANREAA